MNGGSEGGSGAGTPTSDKNHTDNGRHEREVKLNLEMVYPNNDTMPIWIKWTSYDILK